MMMRLLLLLCYCGEPIVSVNETSSDVSVQVLECSQPLSGVQPQQNLTGLN